MDKIKKDFLPVFDVFPEKYGDILCKYIERIDDLFLRYDVVVFMARKAFCFYQALVRNQLVFENEQCIVLSSRALTYNIKTLLKNKRIALVDDVIVTGQTLNEAFAQLTLMKIEQNVDVFIAACCEDVIKGNGILFTEQLQGPYVHLPKDTIYELTGYIANFINKSAMSYNVDEPRYTIKFQSEEWLYKFLEEYALSDITSSSQRKQGIYSYIVHYDVCLLDGLFSQIENGEEIKENTYIKLRVLYNSNGLSVTILPIVLLPELTQGQIDAIFNILGLDKYYGHVTVDYNERITASNKLAFIQYILGKTLAEANINDRYILEPVVDRESEFAILGIYLDKTNPLNLNSDIWFRCQRLSVDNGYTFNDCLAAVYDIILNSEVNKYYDELSNRTKDRFFTVGDIYKKLSNYGQFSIKTLSCIIDILIDRGFLVPKHIFTSENKIVRAYRTGEVTKLTESEIRVFAFFLNVYCSTVDRELDRIEYEKLCVLLYRFCINSHIFRRNALSLRDDNCDNDCFDICYTQFGPRIASSESKYYINSEDSCLASYMKNINLLAQTPKRKYFIPNEVELPAAYVQDKLRIMTFASSMAKVINTFVNDEKAQINERLVKMIESKNDLLTIIAIGNNEREQVLSIVAEIIYFGKLRTGAESIDSMTQIIGSVMDSVWSGIWKYCCFKVFDNIPEQLIYPILKENIYQYLFIEQSISRKMDSNVEIRNFRDMCGNFLIRVAEFYESLKKACTKKSVGKRLPQKIIDLGVLKIDTEREDKQIKWDQINAKYAMLRNEARALVDVCEVYLAESAFSVQTLDTVYVVHSREFLPKRLLMDPRRLWMHGKNFENSNQIVVLRFDNDFDSFNEKTDSNIILHRRENVLSNIRTILSMCENTTVQIVHCRLKSWFEGIQSCLSTRVARGDYFDRLIRKILDYQSAKAHEVYNELLFCRKNSEQSLWLTHDSFRSCRYGTFEIDDYIVEQYILDDLVKNGVIDLKKKETKSEYTGNIADHQTINEQIIIQNPNQVTIDRNGELDFLSFLESDNGWNLIMKELQKLKAESKNHNYPNSKELSTGINDAEEAVRKKDSAMLINALKTIRKVGLSVLEKVAASKILELLE